MEKIVQGKEVSDFVLICDNKRTSGNALLYSFVKNNHKSGNTVHVFLFKHYRSDFYDLLNIEEYQGIKVHDYFIDPMGWEDSDVTSKCINLSSDIDSHCPSNEKVVVIIDSLSLMLRIFNRSKFYWKIQNLIANQHVKQVVALFHSHLHESILHKSLLYMATTVMVITNEADKLISIQNSKQLLSNNGRNHINVCSLTHRKQNGKVLTAIEQFQVLPDNFELVVRNWSPPSITNKLVDVQPEEDPFLPENSDLTFNLSLTSSEKQQRSKLVMPYTRVEIEDDEKKVGSIFYEADEADMFDEDPDDDLDF